ncbi:MAG: cytochrome C oxidase subunit IV family protein [Acidobacteriota bacterium]|jgi:cytochrome c oxidase subunit 4
MSLHVESKRNYILVFAALMVLTALTVYVAYFDFGAWNSVVAMAIAAVKASMVVLIFMHVRHSSPLTKLVVVGALLWMVFMVSLTLGDYLTRGLLGVLGK